MPNRKANEEADGDRANAPQQAITQFDQMLHQGRAGGLNRFFIGRQWRINWVLLWDKVGHATSAPGVFVARGARARLGLAATSKSAT